MSHTIHEKAKLLNKVGDLRDHIEAVARALEDESDCGEVLQLIASARGAVNGLMAEVMEDHIRLHVLDQACEAGDERTRGAEELIEVVRLHLK